MATTTVAPLRRRGVLAPLDLAQRDLTESKANGASITFNIDGDITTHSQNGQNNEDSNSNSNIFEHYISPCEFRVSNDPLLVSEEETCDATVYGCVRDHTFLMETVEEVYEMILQYDYDLYYRSDGGVQFEDIREFLEGAMLEHLASLLNKKQCPPAYVTTLRGPDNRRKLRRPTARKLQGFTDDQRDMVIAINSEPGDEKASESDCLAPAEDGVSCQAMTGYMQLYVEKARARTVVAAEEELEQAMLAAIQSGMDTNVYVNDVVTHVTYIGDRSQPDEFQSPQSSPTTTSAPNSQNHNQTTTTPTEAPMNSSATEDAGQPPFIIAVVEKEPAASEQGGGGGGGLGGTQIGLVAAFSGMFLLFAFVGLLLSSRRRKVESSDSDKELLTLAKLDDGDDHATVGDMSGSPPRSKSAKRTVIAPEMLGRSHSIEGAEIPGSLAAMDALALKPQFRRDEHNNIVPVSDSEETSDWGPQSPLYCSMETEGFEAVHSEEHDSPLVTMESNVSSVPRSPVKNEMSGVSPSRVSPKRLPRPYDDPSAVSCQNGVNMSAKGRIGSDTRRALQGISRSGSADSSFQEQEGMEARIVQYSSNQPRVNL